MLRPVLQYPDPTLAKISEPVAEINDDIRALAQDLLDTLTTVGGVGSAEDAASVVRMLLVPGDGSFTTYLAGADGVCRGRVTAIAWPEG